MRPLAALLATALLAPALLAPAGRTAAADGSALPVWTNATVNPNGDAGMLFTAAERGFGTRFGFDGKMLALKGDPLLLKALLAGQIDSYIGGPGSPLIAAAKGADVRIIGCNWVKQNYVLWGHGAVHTLADLKGRTVGISTLGSAPDLFVRAALRGAGLSVEGVDFVAAGMPPGTLAQLAAGVIDATTSNAEYVTRGRAMGLNLVATSQEATPLALGRCYFTTAARIRAEPELVARFLAAEMAAYRYSLAHRDETIALTRTLTRADAAAREPIDGYDLVRDSDTIDLSFEPPLPKLEWLRDQLATSGQVPRDWPVATMIDRRPLLRARELLAEREAAAR